MTPAQLGDLLERMSDAFVALDRDWRYTYVNRGAGALFNREPASLIGKHIWTEFPEGVGQPFHRAYERAMAEQTPIVLEDYYAPWDRWFENRIYPSPGGLAIFFHEITEQKRAQQAIAASEARFRALVEHAPDGIIVGDEQGRYIDVNASVCVMFGYSRDEMLGMTAADLIDPDVRAEIPQIRAKIASGEPYMGEWSARRKDGTRIFVELHGRLYPDGRRVGILRDITERKRVEALLREREHFLQEVLDAEPGTVYVYDLVDHRNVYINRHWLTAYGYGGEETQAMGSELAQRIFHPEDLARIGAYHEAFRDAPDRDTRSIEYRIRTKAGEWRTLLSREVPFARAADGRVSQILGITHDVTGQRQAERVAVQEAARRKVLFDQAKDGIFVFDESRKVLDANDSFASMLGYTRQEVLTLYPWDWDLVYSSREAMLAAWPEQPTVAETFETRIRRKDGTALDVEISGSPVQWDEQRFTMCVCRDITGRKRVQRAAEEAARQLRELSARLLAAQEDERRRVARELHDELGQTLTALKLRIEARGRVAEATTADPDAAKIRMVDDAIAQVRRLALALRPSMLDDLGLVPALRWLADQTAEHTGLSVHFGSELVGERLAPEIETACFRIAQEALTNVARHARAKRVAVELRRDGPWLALSVQDDGAGFDARAARDRTGRGESFGVRGMQERAALADGRLELESALGLGTQVRARLPWRLVGQEPGA